MGREPGEDRITDETRDVETEDEQVTAGPDRLPDSAEEAAAERAGRVGGRTRRAYRDMAERGAHQEGEGRI